MNSRYRPVFGVTSTLASNCTFEHYRAKTSELRGFMDRLLHTLLTKITGQSPTKAEL